MMEIDIDGTNPLQSTIQQLIFTENLLIKMRVTDIVINALENKVAEKTNAKDMKKYLYKFFDDNKFMRKVHYLSQIKNNTETSIEYHGMDYLSSHDFHYDERFEMTINEIEKKLSKFFGALLRELTKGVDIEL